MKHTPRAPGGSTFILVGLGVVIALLGLLLAAGGVTLAGLGGSWYFLVGGLAMAIAGILIARRKPAGAWLYALFLLGTLAWALADTGLVFWPLFSRLFMFTAIGLVVALAYPQLVRRQARAAYAVAGVLAVGLAIAAGNMFVAHPSVAANGKGPGLTPVAPGKAQQNWAHYGNSEGGSRFAALDQINRGNVDKLQVAWTYHTGDVAISDGNGAEDQLTPLQVGDKVFICTPHNNLIALDADSGRELWKNPINAQSKVWQRCRGMAYFDASAPLAQPTRPGSSPVTVAHVAPGANCQRRLLTNTIDGRLIAVDADTGAFCQGFGHNGQVDLKAGLGNVPDSYYQLSSAPLMAGTTVVVGGRVADNVQTDMPGGVIRGFDVISGAMRWAFDPGNPQQRNAPQGDATYVRSTPNSWAPMSYDPAMNTLFLPMGSSSTDIYGVERNALDHTYGASVLALDATTGNQKWVYQTVHNDLWDFDLPMQPSLIDFTGDDGKTVPAVVIGTKAGQLYVLDRATGKPLTQVDEVPVKPSNIPHEPYSPTQPKSVGMPQIGAQTLTEADMWGATPYDQLLCRIDFKKMRYDGLYTAPGTDLSLSFPGSLGGMNWGSLSTDPVHGFIFVNDMRLGLWIQMVPSQNQGDAASGGEALNTGMGAVPLKGTPYAVNKNRFLSVAGIPCQAPPYGTLTAIDMHTRQIAWQVPVGTVEDTGPLGIRMHLPIKIGLPTLGGTLSTQGGLVFIAGTQDFYLRAYDSSNGNEIWKARLPVGSQGGPMTYVSPKTGKQYVVISAGGARQSSDRGDYVMAYALP
ncbi:MULTISPECIES: glucose/quinate/shikimate family membrane-bound PQQ-dependent dehydrogenase [unclassified Pseudomonas]|uniref:glucose/quinate/shikimate family membrane-bound PQQ-dependent dehydrogenase n=1 Tax=unclassified Pseudomonas TaxID=196821 RepID=UPI00209761DA|nr:MULTISPECIES: glucose/quinate/shikimate family membrane-bound PQQ-dependent dehydrogenase [unclassified Pseudomonas]MCO7519754.1 glucose/quinate/shikimate family membrane-bound PQQ-dependent dehydrogenase [Pseudomonas sp. 1]MCO7540178.1 glucose/quinate/shikimate family membrane-bound PQQ-dependent dehydrogenase [Pseudomonas sp. VA159-2]